MDKAGRRVQGPGAFAGRCLIHVDKPLLVWFRPGRLLNVRALVFAIKVIINNRISLIINTIYVYYYYRRDIPVARLDQKRNYLLAKD